jgi:hypothetical protein
MKDNNHNKYTVEQFQQDINQLGGMIEQFYEENNVNNHGNKKGGARKKRTLSKQSKPKKKKSSLMEKTKNTLKKAKRALFGKSKKGGATKRYYKVVNVNGKPYLWYKRYSGAEPKDAAMKAFHFICKKLDQGKECKITFTLKETTRGSEKRTYGPYKGRYQKLATPRVVNIKGKKITTVTHKRVVELVRGK